MEQIERDLRRTQKFIHWLIDGRFRHCIPESLWHGLTPERVEEIYNVNFGD